MTSTTLLPMTWENTAGDLDELGSTLDAGLPGLGSRERRPISELDEATLISRAGPGHDGAAFAELVRRHQGKVRGLLLRLSGSRSLADDLGQEVFIRAFRGLHSFKGRARLSTWLYRIAYNVFRNHRTRAKPLASLPSSFDNSAPAPESGTSAARCDLRKDLAGAIARLPDKYRGVVVLYYLEELSYPEIATILGCPLGTVKTHLHRAKRLLRTHLPGWNHRAGGESQS